MFAIIQLDNQNRSSSFNEPVLREVHKTPIFGNLFSNISVISQQLNS